MKSSLHLVSAFVLACSGNGTSLDPRNTFGTRDEAYSNGNMFLDVRITSEATVRSEVIGATRSASELWSAEILGFLNRPGAISNSVGATVLVALPAWRDVFATGERQPLDRSRIGVSTLSQGQRYLIVTLSYACEDIPATRVIAPTRVFRLNSNGQLVDSALGYPSGTAVSQILDRATVPPSSSTPLCAQHPDSGMGSAVDGG